MNKETALAIVDGIVEKAGNCHIEGISIIPDGKGNFSLKIFPFSEAIIACIGPILVGKFTLTRENEALVINSK